MRSAVHVRLRRFERAVNDRLPGPVKAGFLTLYLYREGESDLLDRLAVPAWDRWHDLAVGLLLALQVAGLFVVGAAAAAALAQSEPTALNDPVNTVALPGVNDVMPLAAAPYVVAGLLVATVVHEGGHALACRRAGIPVREWGVALLLGVVPLAAYVLPGEAFDDAPAREQARVYAAGVANNLVAAATAGGLLLSPLTASPTAAYDTYFGWALTGGAAPTAESVAALGVLTSLAFWTALLNVNFGVLNALPVTVFDGGRVLTLCLRAVETRLGSGTPGPWPTATVHATSVVAAALVVLAVVGPHL